MTPYQLRVIIYKWKLAHNKYLWGSCFSSGVAFQALDKTGPLLPPFKCIIQVKSTSVQRLWCWPLQMGFSDHGEQYAVWSQDFQIHEIFFFIFYLLNASHLIWSIFCFRSVYSLPMKNVKRKKKRLENMFPFILLDLLFCPLTVPSSNFSHLLILLGDFFHVLFLNQCICYASYYHFIKAFSWKLCLISIRSYLQ